MLVQKRHSESDTHAPLGGYDLALFYCLLLPFGGHWQSCDDLDKSASLNTGTGGDRTYDLGNNRCTMQLVAGSGGVVGIYIPFFLRRVFVVDLARAT